MCCSYMRHVSNYGVITDVRGYIADVEKEMPINCVVEAFHKRDGSLVIWADVSLHTNASCGHSG